MSIERTNTNLAEFCKQVVGTPYWYGTFGQKASSSLYNDKKAQYPSYYNFPYNTYSDDFGKRVTDCAGLVKWFLWSNNMTDKSPTYKASEDYGANTFYSKCTEKGKIASIPNEKIGLTVYRGTDSSKNHIGVVVDNSGNVVEAKGHNYGTIKSNIKDWGYWGKCHLIKYVSQPSPEPTPIISNNYTVNVNSFLSMRTAPTVSAVEKGRLYNGAIVTVTEVKNGWGKVSPNLWCSMTYLKKI